MSRFERQMPVVGEEGQQRIVGARVGIAGCGGIGVHALTSLVEAGVMDFVLCDPAVPEIPDINRQFIYAPGDMRPKSVISAEWALALNYSAMAEAHSEPVSEETVGMFTGCSVVLECTDSPEAGKVMAKWCSENGVPLIRATSDGTVIRVSVSVPGSDYDASEPVPNAPKIGAVDETAAGIASYEALRIIADPPSASRHVVSVDLSSLRGRRAVSGCKYPHSIAHACRRS